jgi:hypothetical protein
MTEDRTTATDPDSTLTYVDETAIVFANNTYQFIVLREFNLPADESIGDRDVLTALVANRHYRGSFVGTGDGDSTIHGPYQVQAITADSFIPVSAADAESLLRAWAEYTSALPEAVRTAIERDVYPRINAATAVYRLPTLPPEARETEWRLALGNATGFHEFVLIDRASSVVTLLIATDD